MVNLTQQRTAPARAVVIGVIVAAVFMANLDLWIVNVALVAMARGLHGTLSSLSWVLNAYAVALAALLIPAGRLGDRLGHRQVFLAGVTLFTLASAACALAPDIAVLVAARVVQAAGAAAQLPTSLALLLAAVDERRRHAAARGWATVGALAAVAGPVLGGLLIILSWRWVFVVNLPVGAVTLALGLRLLPRPPRHEREPIPDLLGSAILIVAVAAMTGALVEAPSWGWDSARTIAMLACSAAGIGVFVWRCLVHTHPMLELPLLRVRRFATANLATFALSVSFAIMLLSNSLWCQDIWHYSALRTGLAMVPGPALVPFATFGTARLVRRIGPGPLAAIGCTLFAVSQLWRVVIAGTRPDYAFDLLPSMVVSGIGVGLALSTLVASGAVALPGHRSATASAILNSGRQLASALGVALLVTVLGSDVGGVRGYDAGWAIGAALAVLGALVSLSLQRPEQPREPAEPAAESPSAEYRPMPELTEITVLQPLPAGDEGNRCTPPALSCGGTAAWSPGSGPTRTGQDGHRSAPGSPR
jgi:EmrB/QacA subfamily drug resistance transporter